MRKILKLKLIFISLIFVYSCLPPKQEVKYIYNYENGKTYSYYLEINGEGVISYFLLSLSGKIKITSDIHIDTSTYKDRKLYTVHLSNIEIESSFGKSEEIKSLFSKDLILSFYMDEKGNKEILNNDILYKFLLDLIIPPLPETDTTNEISFKTFNLNIGDVTVRNEIKSLTKVYPETARNFFFENINEITSLELENKDIVLAEIRTSGKGKVKNYVLYENFFNLDSKTMIPIYKGSLTKVIGFKGKASVKVQMKEKVL